MANDPIVERLHRQREECMERFRYDFDAFVRDLKSREAAGHTPLLEPPARTHKAPRRRRYDRR
jgi:hypothetical protein